MTSIFVTHDQEEALEVADRIVVMDKGRIEQAGTPQQVYEHPQTPFVHEFIGELTSARRGRSRAMFISKGSRSAWTRRGSEGPAFLFARPFDIAVLPSSGENALTGVVKRIHGIGPARRVEIALGNEELETIVELVALRSQQWRIGQLVGLRPQQYRLFSAG